MHLRADLADELVRQRWFAGKGRTVVATELVDTAPGEHSETGAQWELISVRYEEGDGEYYALLRRGERLDVSDRADVADQLLRRIREGSQLPSRGGGVLDFWHTSILGTIPPGRLAPSRLLNAEQSNSSILFGDGLVLKLFRRPQEGINPELEITRFLTERTSFRHAPLLAGAIEYHDAAGRGMACGVLGTFVPNRGDAWSTTLDRLAAVLGGGDVGEATRPLRRLGEVTAELHVALASRPDDAAFAPEPITQDDVDGWIDRVRGEMRGARGALERATRRTERRHVDWGAVEQRQEGLRGLLGTWKTRHHGDDHLGQMLETLDGDFVVIDFEGEPARPLEERRERRPPLRDVAGLLRSLDYARHTALRQLGHATAAQCERANAWHAAARAAILDGYLDSVRRTEPRLAPRSDAAITRALGALEMEKAVYELMYELRNRPDWIDIPLAALVETAA